MNMFYHILQGDLTMQAYCRWTIMQADGAKAITMLRRQRQAQQAPRRLRPWQPVDACRTWNVRPDSMIAPACTATVLCCTGSCDSHMQRFRSQAFDSLRPVLGV